MLSSETPLSDDANSNGVPIQSLSEGCSGVQHNMGQVWTHQLVRGAMDIKWAVAQGQLTNTPTDLSLDVQKDTVSKA